MIGKPFSERLVEEIHHWRETGLIDGDLQAKLVNDANSRHARRSFASVVAILGAILLAAAIIAFVAANWAQMPRLLRVVLLFTGLWSSYVTAYVMERQGRVVLREVCLIAATALFGASIMLIGQIFHLQGDVRDALLLWFAGAVALTLASRSHSVLGCAVLISMAWLIVVGMDWSSQARAWLFWYPLLWAVAAALGIWLKSRLAAHGLALAFVLWQGLLIGRFHDAPAAVFWALFSLNFIIAGVLLYSRQTRRWLGGFETAGLGYAFTALNAAAIAYMAVLLTERSWLGLTSTGALVWPTIAFAICMALALAARRLLENPLRDHLVIAIAAGLAVVVLGLAALVDEPSQYLAVEIAAALYAFFIAIWTVRFGWRIGARPLSAVGYAAFVVIVLVSYAALFGSLQMTAAVYGFCGVLLVAFSVWLAWRERNTDRREPSS